MKRVKAKCVSMVVYKLTPDAPELFGSEVAHDLGAFKAGCDVMTILMKFNTYSRRRTLTQGYYVLSKFRGLSGGVLKIFFWNLKRNRLANLIQLALQQNDVDVAAFAEVNQADFQRLIELLDGQYRPVEAIDDSAKTKLLVKSSICSQHASTVINNLTCTLMLDGVPVNASIVHLPDKRNDPHGDRRERILRKLVIELNTT